jgi:hypothetical protein
MACSGTAFYTKHVIHLPLTVCLIYDAKSQDFENTQPSESDDHLTHGSQTVCTAVHIRQAHATRTSSNTKAKAIPPHAMEALGGTGSIAPTQS